MKRLIKVEIEAFKLQCSDKCQFLNSRFFIGGTEYVCDIKEIKLHSKNDNPMRSGLCRFNEMK